MIDVVEKQQQWDLRFERLRLQQLAWSLEEVGGGNNTSSQAQSLCDLVMNFVGSSRRHLDIVRAAAAEAQSGGGNESSSIGLLRNTEAEMQTQLVQIEAEEERRKEQNQNQQSFDGSDTGGWRQEQWRQRQQICQQRDASVSLQRVLRGHIARRKTRPQRHKSRAAISLQRWWKWGPPPPNCLGSRREITSKSKSGVHVSPAQRYQSGKSGKLKPKSGKGKRGKEEDGSTSTASLITLEWGEQGVRRWGSLRSQLWYRRRRRRAVKIQTVNRLACLIQRWWRDLKQGGRRSHTRIRAKVSNSNTEEKDTAIGMYASLSDDDDEPLSLAEMKQKQKKQQQHIHTQQYEGERALRAMWQRQRSRYSGSSACSGSSASVSASSSSSSGATRAKALDSMLQCYAMAARELRSAQQEAVKERDNFHRAWADYSKKTTGWVRRKPLSHDQWLELEEGAVAPISGKIDGGAAGAAACSSSSGSGSGKRWLHLKTGRTQTEHPRAKEAEKLIAKNR